MKITATEFSSYQEKFALLNREMRWELADIVRDRYLDRANEVLPLVRPKRGFYVRYGKRCLDVLGASIALILTLPLNLIGALVTLVDVGRPILFKQRRLGKAGELFTLIKFRNMREEFDENGHPLPGEVRVTRMGRFARKTSLDELLNFWSVLNGDMSLIGPRPLVPEYSDRYSARHAQRMVVKPGIECPPRSKEAGLGTYQLQFENDVWYVENVSFATDLRLMVRLVGLVLDRRHAKKRSGALKGSFIGYNQAGEVMDSYSIPVEILDEVLRRHGLLVDSKE